MTCRRSACHGHWEKAIRLLFGGWDARPYRNIVCLNVQLITSITQIPELPQYLKDALKEQLNLRRVEQAALQQEERLRKVWSESADRLIRNLRFSDQTTPKLAGCVVAVDSRRRITASCHAAIHQFGL